MVDASEDLRARLAAAKAAREAAEAEMREADEAEADAAAVAAAELAAADARARADARKKLGARGKKWLDVDTDLGVVIVKPAHPAAFKAFQELEHFTLEDCEKLTLPCLFYPSRETFDRMLNDQPAILGRVTNAVAKLAGARKEDQRGKS